MHESKLLSKHLVKKRSNYIAKTTSHVIKKILGGYLVKTKHSKVLGRNHMIKFF